MSAVDQPNSTFSVFVHLNTDKSAVYRAVLRFFVTERARFVISLRPAEILAGLAAVPSPEGPDLDGPALDAILQQLRSWGNLDGTPDNSDAASIEEFYRRRRLYQLSAAGEAAEEALAANWWSRPAGSLILCSCWKTAGSI